MKRLQQAITASTLAFGLCLTPLVASAQTDPTENPMGVSTLEPGDTGVSRSLSIGVDKSIIVDLDRPAADVIITNPEIADATVQTAKRIIFRGVVAGQTNAFIFDNRGRPLLNLEISVAADTTEINAMLKRYVPGARVTVEGANENLIISGTVDNLLQSDQVMRLVQAYMSQDVLPINMMSIRAKDQVMMEVRIVEMQRSVIKQLGINLSGEFGLGEFATSSLQPAIDALTGRPEFFDPDVRTAQIDPITGDVNIITIPGIGTNTQGVGNALQVLTPTTPFSQQFGLTSSNGFSVAGGSLGGLSTDIGYTNYNGFAQQSAAGAAIDALERVGVVRTLAEPNIMAVSGESANFLAGGEFPVPVASDEDGVTVEFKPYGVGLAFTPVVLSEGRISLKISTEISELSNQGAFQGVSGVAINADGTLTSVPGLTIPALVVRRAESVVELPSGGSTMLAGLIQSRSRQTLDQLPGLKKLPILGTLFQSRDFENQETEMVVIVTPYLVDPTQKEKLKTPADGFVNASDPQTIFFGKLNAQYADSGEGLSRENYSAPVGFIEE
ncbi:MAG: type II and III secretion system protein family protein [Pseudomonadota bacterium]